MLRKIKVFKNIRERNLDIQMYEIALFGYYIDRLPAVDQTACDFAFCIVFASIIADIELVRVHLQAQGEASYCLAIS